MNRWIPSFFTFFAAPGALTTWEQASRKRRGGRGFLGANGRPRVWKVGR